MPTIVQPIEAPRTADRERALALVKYLVLGMFFGIVLIKSEVASWYRIQEMFRFQSFHLYGVIGSAVLVAAVSIRVIKALKLRTPGGELIQLEPKESAGRRHGLGGLFFGFGWALTGACPGPIYALIGYGSGVMGVVFLSALAGAWAYGHLRPRLPH